MSWTARVHVGGGHASGQAGFVHVGLGTAERADIRVRWPDGQWSGSFRVFANNFVRIERGKSKPNTGCRNRRPATARSVTVMSLDRDVRLIEAELPEFGVPETRPELPRGALCRTSGATEGAHREGGPVGARRLWRPRAFRQSRLGDRLRSALRGGAAGRRAGQRSRCFSPGRRTRARRAPHRSISTCGSIRPSVCSGRTAVGRRRWPIFSPTPASRRACASASPAGNISAPQEAPDPDAWLDTPSLHRRYAAHVGRGGRGVVNATAILMHATTGLRAVNEIDQLAAFEFAACHVSEAVKRVLFGLRPGMREWQAATLMQPIGMPLSCHLMLSAGPRAALGLGSPLDRPVETRRSIHRRLWRLGRAHGSRRLCRRGRSGLPAGDSRLC